MAPRTAALPLSEVLPPVGALPETSVAAGTSHWTGGVAGSVTVTMTVPSRRRAASSRVTAETPPRRVTRQATDAAVLVLLYYLVGRLVVSISSRVDSVHCHFVRFTGRVCVGYLR